MRKRKSQSRLPSSWQEQGKKKKRSRRTGKQVRRNFSRALAIIIMLLAIGVTGYPYGMQYIYAQRVSGEMDTFMQWVQGGFGSTLQGDLLHMKLRYENQRLYHNGQKDLVDPFSYEQPAVDLSKYGIDDGILAYLEIPAMNIKLPIYLGASEDNMKLGAAHLTQTSYPIGGDNTNSVIAAHRGYSKAAMFRDIEDVSLGDPVYIYTPWGTLNYEVTELEVILPTDTDRIFIREGRDMLTLFTCHPYRQNKQRYVVYCDRVN